MAKETDAPPSSRSSFPRFERVLKALMAVPKKEMDEKAEEIRRKRHRKTVLREKA